MYPILDAFARVFSYREQLKNKKYSSKATLDKKKIYLRVLCLLALLVLVGLFALHFCDVSASEGYRH